MNFWAVWFPTRERRKPYTNHVHAHVQAALPRTTPASI
jgi:hypothetical protein